MGPVQIQYNRVNSVGEESDKPQMEIRVQGKVIEIVKAKANYGVDSIAVRLFGEGVEEQFDAYKAQIDGIRRHGGFLTVWCKTDRAACQMVETIASLTQVFRQCKEKWLSEAREFIKSVC